MVMAQQYFTTHTDVDPKLVAQANELIDKSYKLLVSFECKENGFEWFGNGKGHESLTAYGVLQFTDMATVYPVSEQMLTRTTDWLMGRRDGQGGFDINPRFLHDWGCPKYVADAYIVWSLLKAGRPGLEPEIEALAKLAKEKDDPYFNALVAGSLNLTGRKAEAKELMQRVAKHQRDDGSVMDSKTTVVNSRGDSLLIETTSVAVLAWLTDDAFAGHVEKAVQWLTTRCKDGRYGSTQATVLALKAIVAYDAARAVPKAAGEIQLMVDGKFVAKAPFTTDTTGTISLPDFSHLLLPGEHTIEIAMIKGSRMPFSADIEFFSTKPASSRKCPIALEAKLADDVVKEGETTEIEVTVTNLDQQEGQSMALAIVGLPGGLEPRHEQLKELVKAGTVSAYEVIGRDVVLYFTTMEPGQVTNLRIDTVAAIPGEYTGSASRGYLYYMDEHRHWVDGLSVKIEPR